MENIGKAILFSGMGLAVIAQIAGVFVVFRSSIISAVLSLVVPGYVLIALPRSEAYWKIVGTYLAGLLGVIVGTIVLSR